MLGIGLGGAALIALTLALANTAPDLEGDTGSTTWDLPGLENTESRVALADFSGKPTVAVFFASWCEVCEAEIPGFVTLSDQLGDQVNWVGINSQDNGRGQSDARKWGIDQRWPLARDIGGATGNRLSTATFGARGMPLTVIYDPAGTPVHVQRGGMSATDLLGLLFQQFDIT